MCSHYQGIQRPEAYREVFKAEPPPMEGKEDMWPCYLGSFIRRHPHADVGDEAVPTHEALIGQFGLVPHWADDLKLGRQPCQRCARSKHLPFFLLPSLQRRGGGTPCQLAGIGPSDGCPFYPVVKD